MHFSRAYMDFTAIKWVSSFKTHKYNFRNIHSIAEHALVTESWKDSNNNNKIQDLETTTLRLKTQVSIKKSIRAIDYLWMYERPLDVEDHTNTMKSGFLNNTISTFIFILSCLHECIFVDLSHFNSRCLMTI